jgi:hypothetical protein
VHQLLFLLTLISTLSAVPLRQAEAASDFAATPGHSVELDATDGGVGDDPAETILSRLPQQPHDFTASVGIYQPGSDVTKLLSIGSPSDRPDPPPRRPTRQSYRRALLERYQF